ncbi:Ribonuclease HII [Corynebacterium glutamicum]|nr:Ribonuclease HII [Corynebacterium glutamicum]
MPLIKKHALAWSVIVISAQDIDRFGIQHANISGMRRAVAALGTQPGYVLTDAMKVPGFTVPYLPIIGGDASARCIAAASVLAKQTRDDIMTDMANDYPHYGLEIHKGYSTKIHMDAVRHHGASPEHRYSYANVAKAHQEWLHAADNDTTEGGA